MIHYFFVERSKFFLGWKLTPDDKICHLKKTALVSENFNGISPILKNSLVSINEADGRGAGDGVHVSRIIASEYLSFVRQFGEIP